MDRAAPIVSLSGSAPRILLIDDNPDDRTLVRRELEREWRGVDPVEVRDAAELETALGGDPPDLVITDYRLHYADGLGVVRRVLGAWPDCCVVMLTDSGSEEVAVQAMKEGCAGYVLKCHLRLLGPTARAALEAASTRRALVDTELRLTELFDELPIGAWRATPEGRLEAANPAFLALHRFSSIEDARGTDMVQRYIDPADRETWRAQADAGGAQGFTVHVLRGGGEEFWGRIAARAVRDDRGEVVAYEGTMEDVTAEVEAAAAARAAEARFRALADAPAILVSIWDAQRRLIFHNRAWLDFRGDRHDEESVRMAWDAVHPDDREAAQATYMGAYERREPVTQRYRLRNARGEYRHVIDVSMPWFEPDGSLAGYIGTLSDITDQLADERRRVEAEVRLDTVLAAAPVGVGLVDRDLRYIRVNDALAAFHELPAEEHVGRTVSEVIGPHGFDLDHHYRRVVETGEPVLDVEVALASPRSRRFLASYHPVSVGEEVVGVGIVTVDLTDRLALEAQLLRAQKMEAVGRLAGGIAHDFNNLLAVVTGYAGMIAEAETADATMRAYAEEIADAGKRGAELTGRLLAFSRPTPAAPSEVDLRDVTADIARLSERVLPDGVRLTTETDASPSVVQADEALLGHALMNLILNAAEAMPDGGLLSIRVRADDAHVRVTVTDTGTGIAQHDRDRIFEPFFSTKERGSGLGLATAHGIVERAGGAITVESTVGAGTTFTIQLPRSSAVAGEPGRAATADAGAARGHGETVLVVEDDPRVRALMQATLEAAGYRVLVAADGFAAQILVAAEGVPALVVTDVEMPSLTGVELVRLLRARHPTLRALLVSGYVGSESLAAIGEESYLAKPFTPGELAARVRSLLGA